MNQNIIFSDNKEWDENRKGVVFYAQQAGQLIPCFAPLPLLEKISGTEASAESALELFEECRFDLEDLAEEAIEDEEFSPTGEIELG
ncbi:MAG: DUF1488 domain-containing protein [Vibrio sp.]